MQQCPHIYRVCIVDATRRINPVESKTSRMPTPLIKKVMDRMRSWKISSDHERILEDAIMDLKKYKTRS